LILPQVSPGKLDQDTCEKASKVNQEISEWLQFLSNEPSLGLYYVQDNIFRSVPRLVDLKKNLRSQKQKIEEKVADVEYSIRVIKSLNEINSFHSIQRLLETSTNTLQNLANARNRTILPETSIPLSIPNQPILKFRAATGSFAGGDIVNPNGSSPIVPNKVIPANLNDMHANPPFDSTNLIVFEPKKKPSKAQLHPQEYGQINENQDQTEHHELQEHEQQGLSKHVSFTDDTLFDDAKNRGRIKKKSLRHSMNEIEFTPKRF